MLLSALERRKEEFLKNKSPEEIKQYLNAIEYVRKEINTTQSAENKASRDTNSQTANGKQTPSSEMDLEKYSKILESQNIPAATLWEAAKTMEKNELISKVPSENDTRIKEIILSKKAKENFAIVKQKLNETEKTALQNIDKKDLEIFFKVIKQMQNNLNKERMKIC